MSSASSILRSLHRSNHKLWSVILSRYFTEIAETEFQLIHVMPNIALCMLYEPFVDFRDPLSKPITILERAIQSIIGVLHLIPTNLDVSLIITSVFAL